MDQALLLITADQVEFVEKMIPAERFILGNNTLVLDVIKKACRPPETGCIDRYPRTAVPPRAKGAFETVVIENFSAYHPHVRIFWNVQIVRFFKAGNPLGLILVILVEGHAMRKEKCADIVFYKKQNKQQSEIEIRLINKSKVSIYHYD